MKIIPACALIIVGLLIGTMFTSIVQNDDEQNDGLALHNEQVQEIIEELEPTRRGVYGGSVGYISFNGNMDMAIAIRTLLIKGKNAYLGVGAGIVADSDPEMEYEETLAKARGFEEALQFTTSLIPV